MTAILNRNLTDWTGPPLTYFTSTFYHRHLGRERQRLGDHIATRQCSQRISVNEPITIFTNLRLTRRPSGQGNSVAQNNVAVPGQ